MKLLIQAISRYQDALPQVKRMEVEGDALNKEVVQHCLKTFFEEEDDVDFLDGVNTNRGKKCWCIWGEEEDIIITVL